MSTARPNDTSQNLFNYKSAAALKNPIESYEAVLGIPAPIGGLLFVLDSIGDIVAASASSMTPSSGTVSSLGPDSSRSRQGSWAMVSVTAYYTGTELAVASESYATTTPQHAISSFAAAIIDGATTAAGITEPATFIDQLADGSSATITLMRSSNEANASAASTYAPAGGSGSAATDRASVHPIRAGTRTLGSPIGNAFSVLLARVVLWTYGL